MKYLIPLFLLLIVTSCHAPDCSSTVTGCITVDMFEPDGTTNVNAGIKGAFYVDDVFHSNFGINGPRFNVPTGLRIISIKAVGYKKINKQILIVPFDKEINVMQAVYLKLSREKSK